MLVIAYPANSRLDLLTIPGQHRHLQAASDRLVQILGGLRKGINQFILVGMKMKIENDQANAQKNAADDEEKLELNCVPKSDGFHLIALRIQMIAAIPAAGIRRLFSSNDFIINLKFCADYVKRT